MARGLRLRASRLMPRKGTCPLLQDADWFLRSSWYIYITGWEQMGWKLNCVGRGHEHGTFRPHGVNEQITKAVLQLATGRHCKKLASWENCVEI